MSHKNQVDNIIRSTRRSKFGPVSFKPGMPSILKNTWLYKKFLNCMPVKYSVRFERDLEALRNSSAVDAVRKHIKHHVFCNEGLIDQALRAVADGSPDGQLDLKDTGLVPKVLSKIGEIEFKKLQENSKLNGPVLENLDVENLDVHSEAFKKFPKDAQRRVKWLRSETLKQLLKDEGMNIARAARRKLPRYTKWFGKQPNFDAHSRNVANTVFKEVLIDVYTSTKNVQNQNLVDRSPAVASQNNTSVLNNTHVASSIEREDLDV
ncbi:hypothetical protein [Labrenzia sp. THAF82]|uniref:hypothetical protein n=1 Tax=Labrenzia sp. THAF82 TaxID=2587861 RepID=UPI0012689430|nr:hypothetical protein [Labrenzia sp. THAF82]